MFSEFDYSTSIQNDGIQYSGKASLRSVGAFYDQYLIGGFHVSPGVLAYNDNHVTGSASLAPGQSFSLGSVTYVSSQASPVIETGSLPLGSKVAPALLIGFGNLLPRSTRHFTVNFDLGVVYQGSPKTSLELAGSTCQGSVCLPIGANPTIQTNILAEQTKFNNQLSPYFKFYPVISLSFGWKF
jgi:hypothetical protein